MKQRGFFFGLYTLSLLALSACGSGVSNQSSSNAVAALPPTTTIASSLNPSSETTSETVVRSTEASCTSKNYQGKTFYGRAVQVGAAKYCYPSGYTVGTGTVNPLGGASGHSVFVTTPKGQGVLYFKNATQTIYWFYRYRVNENFYVVPGQFAEFKLKSTQGGNFEVKRPFQSSSRITTNFDGSYPNTDPALYHVIYTHWDAPENSLYYNDLKNGMNAWYQFNARFAQGNPNP